MRQRVLKQHPLYVSMRTPLCKASNCDYTIYNTQAIAIQAYSTIAQLYPRTSKTSAPSTARSKSNPGTPFNHASSSSSVRRRCSHQDYSARCPACYQ